MKLAIGYLNVVFILLGYVIPVFLGFLVSGWKKEIMATVAILLLSVLITTLSTLFYHTDFALVLTRAVLIIGLPYGFALRYIRPHDAQTTAKEEHADAQ